jgi:hypothetical protein
MQAEFMRAFKADRVADLFAKLAPSNLKASATRRAGHNNDGVGISHGTPSGVRVLPIACYTNVDHGRAHFSMRMLCSTMVINPNGDNEGYTGLHGHLERRTIFGTFHHL